MRELPIWRDRASELIHVGSIDLDARRFAYAERYLHDPQATPISFSLPLIDTPFEEASMRPYFEGLLPEGPALRALAQRLEIREEDYLAMLACCGLDCIGDVVVDPQAYADQRYEPIAFAEIERTLANPSRITEMNYASRLSLAGTQEKIGMHHAPGVDYDEGWSRPLGGAASTHILKAASVSNLAIVEYLSMKCAEACNINCAETHVLGTTGITCSKRFDRETNPETGATTRLHQEDFAQIFGLLPGSKYAEIPGGTIAAITRFIADHSDQPLRDVATFAKLACFNYLIGNCDNHLKNVSILYSVSGKAIHLAPAYDLVCTTVYERFSREMAMAIGGERAIDNVTPSHLRHMAHDLGITQRALKTICAKLADCATDALKHAGDEVADVFPVAPYCADDIQEDMAPRLEVLREFSAAK